MRNASVFLRPDWANILPELPPEERRAMTFLYEHLPESDLDCCAPALFLRFARHALALRETAAWCGALDWEIFAHYVLFPRVNDEDLSFHRELFHDALWPRVKDLPSPEARILEVNRWCHEHASYQAQDERTASPLTVYRCGSGRCGEESAFLVSALRSVGIPARQVYAPRWSHCDDNHAWVEALCGETWHFLGACEPEPVLDRGWFTTAAARAMLVHSRIFGAGTSPLHGEPLGRDGGVSWFNQTPRYARTAQYRFQAMENGRPAVGARFELQILNEAAFHTIAVLTADEQGFAQASLGLGSLHALASLNGLTAEGACPPGGLVLHLTPPEQEDAPWQDFDFRAPEDSVPPPSVLSPALKAERAQTRRRGNELRRQRLAGCYQPGRESCADLLRAARGNCGELNAFLSGDRPAQRERLLRTLSDKDLRDVSRDTLEDHFTHLPPCPDGTPEDIYWRYTACPRIALEKLSGWRGPLGEWLSDWTGSPAALWLWLKELLPDRTENIYRSLFWTPEHVPEAGGCDEKSRRTLFIAALRTLGVPARLRALDGAPEVWRDGAFHPVLAEETSVLHLTCGGGQPLYKQDWTISRQTASGWQRLDASGAGWEDGALTLELPAGRYRLITTVRLPSGDQLAAKCELSLAAGAERTVPLRLRSWTLDDLLTCQTLPVLSAVTPEGEQLPDLFRTDGRPTLAFWLEEGGEPTEHVLNELLACRQAVRQLPARVVFLLRGRESMRQPTLANALSQLPNVQVLLDDWAYDLEAVARHLGRDPDAPPLAVVSDGAGCAVYSVSGYRVGSAALLLRVISALS